MCANGVFFRPETEAADDDNWELSIPLSHSDYIHLGRPFRDRAHEFALTVFIGVLRDTMRTKLAQFAARARREVETKAASFAPRTDGCRLIVLL